MSPIPLHCYPQSYDWGKPGTTSLVAHLSQSTPNVSISPNKPYAELWMGTHPSLPSKLATSESGAVTLKDYINENPKVLGSQGGKDLPFLFKVLSIGKALSIQAHPDKKLGKRLHEEQPNIYKDPNHKPEMAIALTPFSAFCGFRPLPQILTFLETVPEFKELAGSSVSQHFISTISSSTSTPSEQTEALKQLFGAIMSSTPESYGEAVESLVKRLKSEGIEILENEEPKDEKELILRLNEQFPKDVGIMCTYLLNIVKLNPGEAIFLGANEPHAYLSGDIIECMATSDSVIRAGLTPKLRDVPVLLSMLTYTSLPAAQQLLKPTIPTFSTTSSNKSLLYDPPIKEFSVVRVSLKKGEEEGHKSIDGPSIIVVTKGKGRVGSLPVELGSVLFVGAGEEVKFEGKEDGLEAFRAFVEGFLEDEE